MKKEVPGCCNWKTMPVILLVIGIVWFFNELGLFRINIPWVPLVLIIVAIGWMKNKK